MTASFDYILSGMSYEKPVSKFIKQDYTSTTIRESIHTPKLEKPKKESKLPTRAKER